MHCLSRIVKGHLEAIHVENIEGTLQNQKLKKILENAEYGTKICVDATVNRSRKMTGKGLKYKLGHLKLKRERLNSKLLRKSSMMSNIMYSFGNLSAVSEEMQCFSDLVKLFTTASQEYQQLLTDEDLQLHIQWIEEQEEQILCFKHKAIKWLKEAELAER